MNELPVVKDDGSVEPGQPVEPDKPVDPEEPEKPVEPEEPDKPIGDIPVWDASVAYSGGDKVVYNGKVYQASWWTQGTNPETQGDWGPWKLVQ